MFVSVFAGKQPGIRFNNCVCCKQTDNTGSVRSHTRVGDARAHEHTRAYLGTLTEAK